MSPDVSKAHRTQNDISMIFKLQQDLGNRWAKIAARMQGWSQNSLRNFFNSTLRRNIRRFNKGKPQEEQIDGEAKKLIECQEIREILIVDKSTDQSFFANKSLSERAINFIASIANNKTKPNVPNYDDRFFESFENVARILVEYFDSN